MSFWGSFSGRSQRRDLENAYQGSVGDLEHGYNEAASIGQDYYGRAQNYLSPYIQRGNDADLVLRNALGLNGREAQSGYYRDFQTDPGFQSEVDAGVRALDRSATARGGIYSGAAMKAVQGFGQQKMGEAYRNRFNALSNYGQQGFQASQAAAGLAGNMGSTMMGLRFGWGQQNAQNRIQYGNAMANSHNTPWNNVLGLGGLAVRGYSAYSAPGRPRTIGQE